MQLLRVLSLIISILTILITTSLAISRTDDTLPYKARFYDESYRQLSMLETFPDGSNPHFSKFVLGDSQPWAYNISPNGQWVVIPKLIFKNGWRTQFQIYTTSTGQQVTQIDYPSDITLGRISAWLADGQSFMYVTPSQLLHIDIAQRKIAVISDLYPKPVFVDEAPLHNIIIYRIDNANGTFDYYTYNRITSQSQPLVSTKSTRAALGLSPNQDWFYFFESTLLSAPTLHRIRLNGAELTALSADSTPNFFEDWGWSADGNWLYAFNSLFLYKIPLETTNEISEVSFIGNGATFQTHSPDHQWYYFSFRNGGLYRFRSDGTASEQLLPNGISNAIWSPDGQWLYYRQHHLNEGKVTINRMHIDNPLPTELISYIANLPAYYDDWQWSPDGNWLLFQTDNGAYSRMTPDGTTIESVLNLGNEFQFIAWSPPIEKSYHPIHLWIFMCTLPLFTVLITRRRTKAVA